MSTINITTRYAKALLDFSEEKKSSESVSHDIELVYKTLSGSKELRSVMTSPVLRSDKKKGILKSIFAGKVNQDVLNFILFIIDKNREEYLFGILKRYQELNDVKLGIVSANVQAPETLNEQQQQKLKDKLEKFTGKKVNLNVVQKKDLLGGFIVRIGDTVFDASVDHQLELLKKKFLSEQTVAAS